ncbi:hypothetical protein S1361_12640 [Streptomyces cyanogenus]|uniref:Uncharacterized protein n=1 Tax=Streptomyces cyanogenus TaxID=80860 RepID=A0ABX7TNK9_STRCY|nr:hypothetical protein S1361_12640 [Streptomyces cyanogenus]
MQTMRRLCSTDERPPGSMSCSNEPDSSTQQRLYRLRPEGPVDERLREPAGPQRRQAHPLFRFVCHHRR